MALTVEGRTVGLLRAQREQRWHTYHLLLPSWGKHPPSLAKFLGPDPGQPRAQRQTTEEIDTVMRKWRAVMAAVEAQQPKRKGRSHG